MIVTVDTGGTKTLVAGFHKNGEPGQEHRFPTPHNDTEAYLATLTSILDEFYKPEDIDAISIAVPSVVKDGVAIWSQNIGWRNFDLLTPLKERYACPIFMMNDADVAGLAEANALDTIPQMCLYVTVSTGIGSGIVVNGRLTPELTNSEAGHMMLEYDGRVRSWESFASGKAIHATYGKYAYEITDKRTWDRIAKAIAHGLLAVIPTIQPDVVVIGGSIGTHFEHYDNTLKAILKEKLAPFITHPTIRQAKHPQEAVIYGCYYYAVHQLTDKSA